MDPVLKVKKLVNSNDYKEFEDYNNKQLTRNELQFHEKYQYFKQFIDESKNNKLSNSLKLLWIQEREKLNKSEKNAERAANEISQKLKQSNTDLFEADESNACSKRFDANVIQPVRLLRSDLLEWIQRKASHEKTTNPAPILDIISGTHTKLHAISVDMADECRQSTRRLLEDFPGRESMEFNSTLLLLMQDEEFAKFPDTTIKLCTEIIDKHPSTGIPDELYQKFDEFELDHQFERDVEHDDDRDHTDTPLAREEQDWQQKTTEMAGNLFEQIISLDSLYQSKVHQIHMKLLNTLQSLKMEPDLMQLAHHVYQISISNSSVNRYQSAKDFLKLLLPRFSSTQINDVSQAFDSVNRCGHTQTAMLHDWTRDRDSLISVAFQFFERLRAEMSEHLEVAERRRHSLDKCTRLNEAVAKWREERALEMERLERERQACEESRRTRERDKFERHQTQNRRRVEEWRADQTRRRALAEQRAHSAQAQRDKCVAEAREQQAGVNRERVKFRADQLAAKRWQRDENERTRATHTRLVERQLERLRERVRPQLPRDPARFVVATENWRHRNAANAAEMEVAAAATAGGAAAESRSEARLNTYDDAQIMSDPRTRLEIRLREHGLLPSKYASKMMTSELPVLMGGTNLRPRPDTKSTQLAYLQNNNHL